MGRGVLLTLPRCCPDADVGEMLGMLLLPPGEALVERRGDLMGGGRRVVRWRQGPRAVRHSVAATLAGGASP